MSVRAIRLSAAFILAGLAFGAAPAAPAFADGMIARPTWHHPRHVVRERVRVVRQVVYVPQYVATSCGGCGSAYAAPQYYAASTYIPYRHIAPQAYYYGTSCGGCGGYATVAPRYHDHHHHQYQYGGGYIAPRQQYHSTADLRPARYSAEEYQAEQEPVYVAPRRHRFHTLRSRY
jgi:hypothetical protein